jgi:hypothetical protein
MYTSDRRRVINLWTPVPQKANSDADNSNQREPPKRHINGQRDDVAPGFGLWTTTIVRNRGFHTTQKEPLVS